MEAWGIFDSMNNLILVSDTIYYGSDREAFKALAENGMVWRELESGEFILEKKQLT